MSSISIDQVKHIANLARLEITKDEAEKFAKQLAKIISFAEQLNELNTDHVEPTSHIIEMNNVMREDISEKGLSREEILNQAPDHQNGQIKVPSILE